MPRHQEPAAWTRGTNGKFGLSDKASMEIMKLFFTPNEELYGKQITDFFDDEVLEFELLDVLAHHVRLRELA